MAKENDEAPAKGEGQSHSPEYKTVVKTKITEEEQNDLIESFSKPIQALDNALEKQRQEERNTMKLLIEENVKMEREVKRAEERVQEIHTKMELMKLDVEAEKARTKEREQRIKEMEGEMTMLILAKKSEKNKEKKSRKAEQVESKAEDISSKYQKESDLPHNEKYERRIKDLNLRLKRMAADDEAKDQRIINLEEQLEATEEYGNELEKEVDSGKVESIRKRLEEKRKNKNVHYYDKANIVRKNGEDKKSEVCVMQ